MRSRDYKTQIRKQVQHENNGEVPENLTTTIDQLAEAMAWRDQLSKTIQQDGFVITDIGSTGQATRKQHPLITVKYQQDLLILNYHKALGFTSAKAAVKVEPKNEDNNDTLTAIVSGLQNN